MSIREIKLDDAESLVKLIKKVESESQYILFESGERKIDMNNKEKG